MKNGYQQHFQKLQANKGNRVSTAKPKDTRKNTQKIQLDLNEKTKKHVTVEELRQRLISQEKTRKKPNKFPVKLVLTSMIGLFVAGAGLTYLTEIERIVKKVEVSFFGYALAEEKAPESKPAEKKEEPKKEDTNTEKQVKKEFTDEEVNHFAKLNERKRELDAREEELNRLESELAAQKVALEKRLSELDKTRRDISSVLEEKVKTDDKKVESLVSVYSSMKPQQAAKVFESMDEDLAIEILGRMKKKPAAEILNLVKAEKAQVLSEKYAGYKRK